MSAVFSRLWNDESGAILSAEVMLIGTILVIGMIVGLKALRDSVVTELADLAQAIANVNQSYSYSGVAGHHSFTGGGFFHDLFDFCDTEDPNAPGQQSKCVVICQTGTAPICGGEGDGTGGF